MSSDFDILIDSDAFVGLYLPDDAHFERASQIFERIKNEQQQVVTTSWVVAETATVLSHQAGQETARKFLRMIKTVKFPTIHLNEKLQEQATDIFMEQALKGTSMTDCGNVAVMQRFAIPTIFSFDKVYTKKFGLKTAA